MTLIEGLSLGASAIACLGVLFNIRHGSKQENSVDTQEKIVIATNHTEVMMKLEMVSDQIVELRRTHEKTTEKLMDQSNRQLVIEGKIEKLFEYKDDIENRLRALENKS